jgi:hypothetical protein
MTHRPGIKLIHRACAAWLSALVVAVSGLALMPAAASAKFCGQITVHSDSIQTVSASRVSCHTAKAVIRSYLNTGHASGWACRGGLGISRCTRDNSTVRSGETDND